MPTKSARLFGGEKTLLYGVYRKFVVQFHGTPSRFTILLEKMVKLPDYA